MPRTGRPPVLSPQQQAEACERYLSGESSCELGRAYECDPQTVSNVLFREGIELRKRSVQLREDAFEELSLEGCYWLGFIEADGCVKAKSPRWRITIELSSQDREHLEAAKSFFGPDLVIRERFRKTHKKAREDKGYSRIVLCSKQLAQNADQFLSTRQWRKLPRSKAVAFLSGVFDGDGYIGRTKALYGFNYEWSMVARPKLAAWIHYFVRSEADVNVQTRPKPGNIIEIRVRGRLQVSRVIQLIRSTCPVHLQRKKMP